MAIFELRMQIIKRSEGRSAVAAAAYRSATKIENTYTGDMEDYSRKKWVEYSEILLPENAPREFQDRAVLWNSVENTEKGSRARLAREIQVALPVELSMEENIRLIQEFIQNTFISDGMVADVNIHCPPVTDENKVPIDKNGNRAADEKDIIFRNPHAHILLTVRPLDQDGTWMAKAQKEYLCKRGEETRAFTAGEFKQAKADGWEKQYQYWRGKRKVWLTPSEAYIENLVRVSKNPRSTPYGRRDQRIDYWNSPDAVFAYRKSWEEHVNQALERAGRPERITCQSYQEQGADTISGIHLGSYASKNPKSERYRINEEIRALNQANKAIRKTLDDLEVKIKEKSDSFYEELAEQFGRLEAELLSAQYSMDTLSDRQGQIQKELEQTRESIQRVQTAQKKCQEKDCQSQERISHLQKQLAETPLMKNRYLESIRAEQENIQFRKQRLDRILEEEGFSSLSEFDQKLQSCQQLEQEWEDLSSRLASCDRKMQYYIHRYEEICQYLPKDTPGMEQFLRRKDDWTRRYRDKTADHIRKHKHLDMPAFLHAVQKTEHTLNHIFYVTGRAQYLLSQVKKITEDPYGDSRNRLP